MAIPRQLPNAITIVRILCAPVFLWMLLADGGADGALRWWAAVLFIVAIATDGIDGYLARANDIVTDLGKLLDPIADKVLTGFAFIGLSVSSPEAANAFGFTILFPVTFVSSAFVPPETMPDWLQPLTMLNPIHHFATIVRGAMLKGVGLATLWPNVLALLVFTLVLVSLSIWRFRKQLS